MKVKVKNMKSSQGNSIPNQFIIETDEGTFFQSYQSIIAFRPFSRMESFVFFSKKNRSTGIEVKVCEFWDTLNGYPAFYLDKTYWDYSTTTGKYRNQFLGETKKETEKKIKSGEYALVDLN